MSTGKMNSGLLYGLLAAAAGILFTLVLYIAGASWFVSPVAFLAYVIPIVFAVLAGQAVKKSQGGYLEFSEALKATFTVFVIWSFLGIAFNYILLNFIDVPFREALAQITAQKSEEFMQKLGAPQADIDKATEQMLNGNSYNLKSQFMGFAFGTIIWFLICLIISAIIKRKKPEFDTNSFNQP